MAQKRYLVTGGHGFIGSALVRRLVGADFPVRVLDNRSRNSGDSLADVADRIDIVNGSICDPETVAEACRGMDAVVHLAAINGTEFFYSKPDQVLEVGVRGMLNLLDGCRRHDVGELVVASSSEVYQTAETVPTDETVPLVIPDITNPRYSYGGSKLISELLAMWCSRNVCDRVVIFRPHNVYGPNMGWEHVLPHFILRAVDAIATHPKGPVPFAIQGDGRQTRAFTHVDDCVDGLMILLAKGKHQTVYHIGNPEELEISEVARRVVGHFGREALIVPSEAPAGGTPRRCPDIGRMRALGFAPRIPFADGLPGTIDWYAAQARRQPAPARIGKSAV